MSYEAEDAINSVCFFIKNNQFLMHLDLSNTEMREDMLKMLIDAIAQSYSLMAVHLDGNPGLTPDFKQYCVAKLTADVV